MIERMNRYLKAYIPMAEALRELFHPFVEVSLIEGTVPRALAEQGKQMKRAQVTVCDLKNQPVGLIDIRVDTTCFSDVQRLIGSFLSVKQEVPSERIAFEQQVERLVDSYLRTHRVSFERLKRTHKKALVLEFQSQGIFNYKLSVPYIADLLKLSRATIYNYIR